MSSLEFFKSKTLLQMIEFGCFGPNSEIIGVVQQTDQAADQFMSTVKFLEVEVLVSGVKKVFPLVCKFQSSSAESRETFKTYWQFFNENLFYKDVIPLLPKNIQELFPEFYFGNVTLNKSPEEDVIVIENLIPKGYTQSKERIFLDYEHCLLIFKSLGKLHGASLQLKETKTLEFANNVTQFKETRWLDDCKNDLNYFYRATSMRGIKPLVESGEYNEVLEKFLIRLDNVFLIIKDILKVNNMSVLCHGDYCRNNMVFKYKDGHPIDVKFYDLATPRYASPIIDISFFLFLNTTSELRHKHFKQDFLPIYLDAVKSVADTLAPNMTELWTEFQQKAVYGYFLISFFLPIMMTDLPAVTKTLSLKERVSRNLMRGGQKVTDILTDCVKDLINWGCL